MAVRRKTIKRKFKQNPFDDEQYYKEIIDHAVQTKNRANVRSRDDKFHIIGVITKLKKHYSVEVKDKYGIAANVVFELKDILDIDLESATIKLK